MTRNRDIERVLETWFSEGPTLMPDHLFDAVVDRIDRVPQRRLARIQTRFPTMPSNLRLPAIAAMVAIVVVAIGALAILTPPAPDVGTGHGGSPTPSPSAASPSPRAQLIADGTYALAPMKVSDLTAMINGDSKLSAAEKTFLIDTAFAMKGGTTLRVWLDLRRGLLVERQAVDAVENVGTRGTYTFPDDRTMVFQEECACPPQTFRVAVDGDTFTLEFVNPPTKEVDAIPVRVLYGSGPFTRQP